MLTKTYAYEAGWRLSCLRRGFDTVDSNMYRFACDIHIVFRTYIPRDIFLHTQCVPYCFYNFMPMLLVHRCEGGVVSASFLPVLCIKFLNFLLSGKRSRVF